MTVSPAGLVTLTLAGRAVASGNWQLLPQTYLPGNNPAPADLGPIVSTSADQTRPDQATVHEQHAAVRADYRFDLAGEDLIISAHVANRAPRALRPIAFGGLTFHFNPAVPVTGNLKCWYPTYLQAKGILQFHPGLANPLGVWWAGDDRFAFSAHSPSEFDRSDLITAAWTKDDVIPTDCQLQFHTDRAVPPGGAADVTLTIRLSTDRSLPHLIEPYKRAYDRHFPLPLYTPAHRWVCQNAAVGENLITRQNPYGYNGAFRRLDTPFGTAAYLRAVVPILQQADALGIIIWSPGGARPPMYPPDFDLFPPAVLKNLPTFLKGFHDRGLRVGLCARAGDGVTRPPGADPIVYRLSADDPAQMRQEMDRFRHAMTMGFDLFYLDNFGAEGQNDLRILRLVRDTVGPDVPLYTEYCTDVSLAWADHYCEWLDGDQIRNTTPAAYAALRLLRPDATWLCHSFTRDAVPPAFERLGLVPLIGDERLNQLGGVRLNTVAR